MYLQKWLAVEFKLLFSWLTWLGREAIVGTGGGEAKGAHSLTVNPQRHHTRLHIRAGHYVEGGGREREGESVDSSL